MKMKRGFKALIVVFFFFSFLSSVYLFKPMGLNNLASFSTLMEQIKLESSSENGTDVKALKAIINFAKRYLPIS
jgi:hypothetical protein